ncbi:NAD(P)-dependent oxidoreductase [Mangrovihabitans endophyticus]|uniref:3-hydroxyisobutyrate dehydrogenase n=1 Tax=Mangrovihabitans endophyticus TaxID=1751298 RepID=A0A8J3C3S8_9ACTN|nr:NAD(P)-dependent oxidoreductase [Mangrovihabitans endophyticus]GGL14487.1 3-hydroxyisobutyrate dehydrogenase [Mangrovihabitans endophyticus]
MRTAVLGAGVMGAGMVRSLRRAGHEVAVWNRTASKSRELATEGVVAAPTVTDAVRGADAVITMLFDADATLAVKAELTGALAPGAVWIQAGTLGLEGVAAVADGVTAIVDAPVLGTKKPAEDGALVVLASGDSGLLDHCKPVFEAIGSRTLIVGDTVGQASALKLVCNSWVALIMAGTAQSVQFARALGVDPRLFLDAIDGGPIGAPYAQLKGKAILAGDYQTSFAVDGVVKDVQLMVDAAERSGFPPELLSAVKDLYAQASASGHGGADMAAVAEAFRN